MRFALLVSFVAAGALAGCAAGTSPAHKARTTLVVDSARVAVVERAADDRGVRVVWINAPMTWR
jgi:hypothetical protein